MNTIHVNTLLSYVWPPELRERHFIRHPVNISLQHSQIIKIPVCIQWLIEFDNNISIFHSHCVFYDYRTVWIVCLPSVSQSYLKKLFFPLFRGVKPGYENKQVTREDDALMTHSEQFTGCYSNQVRYLTLACLTLTLTLPPSCAFTWP